MIDKTPTYNLKAVVQETGLKPDTLRAWERRYGIPEPDRSQGGHRLYSDYDIQILKWLLARQDEGLSISRAVKLWHYLGKGNKDPFDEMPLDTEKLKETVDYPLPDSGNRLSDLRNGWIDACMNFNEMRAEAILAQAFSYYPPEMVCFELLQKAIVAIGAGWYAGETTVQQEHFASALALRRLDALLAAAPPPTRPERIIVGCPPKETHTFSPLLIAYLLRRRGWHVVYLGADVPTDRLQVTIARTRPDLIVFSAQLLHTAASLLDVALLMREKGAPLAYGGMVFNTNPTLRERIPGHFLGEDLKQVTAAVERLLANRPEAPGAISLSEEFQHALGYFRERAGLIDSEIWQRLSDTGLHHVGVAEANRHMQRDIIAALTLGDLDFLGHNIHWLEGLMVNYRIEAEKLYIYLDAYYAAAQKHLAAEAGRPVLLWLEQLLATRDELWTVQQYGQTVNAN